MVREKGIDKVRTVGRRRVESVAKVKKELVYRRMSSRMRREKKAQTSPVMRAVMMMRGLAACWRR